MNKKFIVTFLVFVCVIFSARAQRVGIKTNLLYDATATANLGVEIGLSPKWTIDISGNYNAWQVGTDNGLWKHAFVQPEARWWFCDRFSGHFLGVHALGGIYNFGGLKWMSDVAPGMVDRHPGLVENRYQGWAAGAGVAYGYAFMLGKHWNLELELGLGYVYFEYDKFECEECGRRLETEVPRHYVGPTKAAVSLVYLF